MRAVPPSGFAARLAGLYAAIFIVGGFQLPFFPVWLKAKGLDAGEIGLVLAVPMVVRVLAIPIATRAADRREALREAILIASCLTVLGYLMLALTDGVWGILIAFALASLAYTPIMPLAETYALKGLAARGRAYGPVRLWGSAAFVGGTFLAGFAADAMDARHLIWPILAGTAVLALSATLLAPLETGTRASGRAAAPRPLLRDPAFIAVMAAASLIQASHAVYYGFSALAWKGQGFDGTTIAALWALGVVAEIVLFALSGRLPAVVDPAMLLLIGALGGALRWAAMALDPPGFALPLLQLLHAASFGATHLGALMFMSRHAPAGQSATAQGYLAIAMGLVMAGATGLSGVLFEAFGSLSYAAMSVAAIAGGIGALIARRTGRVAAAL
ncbi:MAG: MFS transporter [Pseudolabrys sp.]